MGFLPPSLNDASQQPAQQKAPGRQHQKHTMLQQQQPSGGQVVVGRGMHGPFSPLGSTPRAADANAVTGSSTGVTPPMTAAAASAEIAATAHGANATAATPAAAVVAAPGHNTAAAGVGSASGVKPHHTPAVPNWRGAEGSGGSAGYRVSGLRRRGNGSNTAVAGGTPVVATAAGDGGPSTAMEEVAGGVNAAVATAAVSVGDDVLVCGLDGEAIKEQQEMPVVLDGSVPAVVASPTAAGDGCADGGEEGSQGESEQEKRVDGGADKEQLKGCKQQQEEEQQQRKSEAMVAAIADQGASLLERKGQQGLQQRQQDQGDVPGGVGHLSSGMAARRELEEVKVGGLLTTSEEEVEEVAAKLGGKQAAGRGRGGRGHGRGRGRKTNETHIAGLDLSEAPRSAWRLNGVGAGQKPLGIGGEGGRQGAGFLAALGLRPAPLKGGGKGGTVSRGGHDGDEDAAAGVEEGGVAAGEGGYRQAAAGGAGDAAGLGVDTEDVVGLHGAEGLQDAGEEDGQDLEGGGDVEKDMQGSPEVEKTPPLLQERLQQQQRGSRARGMALGKVVVEPDEGKALETTRRGGRKRKQQEQQEVVVSPEAIGDEKQGTDEKKDVGRAGNASGSKRQRQVLEGSSKQQQQQREGRQQQEEDQEESSKVAQAGLRVKAQKGKKAEQQQHQQQEEQQQSPMEGQAGPREEARKGKKAEQQQQQQQEQLLGRKQQKQQQQQQQDVPNSAKGGTGRISIQAGVEGPRKGRGADKQQKGPNTGSGRQSSVSEDIIVAAPAAPAGPAECNVDKGTKKRGRSGKALAGTAPPGTAEAAGDEEDDGEHEGRRQSKRSKTATKAVVKAAPAALVGAGEVEPATGRSRRGARAAAAGKVVEGEGEEVGGAVVNEVGAEGDTRAGDTAAAAAHVVPAVTRGGRRKPVAAAGAAAAASGGGDGGGKEGQQQDEVDERPVGKGRAAGKRNGGRGAAAERSLGVDDEAVADQPGAATALAGAASGGEVCATGGRGRGRRSAQQVGGGDVNTAAGAAGAAPAAIGDGARRARPAKEVSAAAAGKPAASTLMRSGRKSAAAASKGPLARAEEATAAVEGVCDGGGGGIPVEGGVAVPAAADVKGGSRTGAKGPERGKGKGGKKGAAAAAAAVSAEALAQAAGGEREIGEEVCGKGKVQQSRRAGKSIQQQQQDMEKKEQEQEQQPERQVQQQRKQRQQARQQQQQQPKQQARQQQQVQQQDSSKVAEASDGALVVQVGLTGMHSDERSKCAALLRKLKVDPQQPQKVKFSSTNHDWQAGTTHLVAEALKRNEKTLCGMAAGAWLVGVGWLEAAAEAGAVKEVEEEGYELQGDANGVIAVGE